MIQQRAVTIDTSVWIPFLRTRQYARTVDPLIAAGRAWVHPVVLLELYAGTANPADARVVDRIPARRGESRKTPFPRVRRGGLRASVIVAA